jgi:carbon-monoxide dehydrogenase large subunit
MSAQGVGASVRRKKDNRFLRGRGQYTADFRLPGARAVAFMRRRVERCRIRNLHVLTTQTAAGPYNVKLRRAATALGPFKHPSGPMPAQRS